MSKTILCFPVILLSQASNSGLAETVRARAIPAPMLYERAPHTGGATAVPSPSAPWHLTQLAPYTRAPAAVSAVRAAQVASRLDAPAGATGTSRDRNHR